MFWVIRVVDFCIIPVFLAQSVEYFAHSDGNGKN